MPWVKHERGHRAPGRNTGPGGVPTPTAPRQCAVCGREFHRRRYTNGRMETLGGFKRRVACSKVCAAAFARQARAALAAEGDEG